MPAARKAVSPIALVPTVAEIASAPGSKRVRLSRALAATAKAAEKQGGTKLKKGKLLSERYTIPVGEYADLVALKKRLDALGIKTKKSVLLRAGLKLLAAMTDAPLKRLVAGLEPVGNKERLNGKAA